MADTLGAVLAGINNGVSNGLDLYKTMQGEARANRQEKLQKSRYSLEDARYTENRDHTLEREGVLDQRYVDEKAESTRRWDIEQEAAERKAVADAAYKARKLQLTELRTAATVQNANTKARDSYAKEVKGIVDGAAKLVTPEGDVTGSIDYFNNTPGGLMALADTLGFDGDPKLLEGAQIVNAGGMVMLAKPDKDGKPQSFDIDGDGKADTIGMPQASFANRLGVNTALLQEQGAKTLGNVSEVVSQYSSNKAGAAEAATLAEGEEARRRTRVQTQAANNPTNPRDEAYGYGMQVRRNNRNMEAAAANSQQTLADVNTRMSDVGVVEARGQEQAQQIAGLKNKFQGAELNLAANNVKQMLVNGQDPQWYDFEYANLPADERQQKGVEVRDKTITDLAGSIEGKIYRKDEKDKTVGQVSGDEITASIKSTLLARPDLIAEINNDKTGRTKGLVLEALKTATSKGRPEAVQFVLDSYKQKLDGGRVLDVAAQLPQKKGSSNKQHYAQAMEVVKFMEKNQIDDIDEALGQMQ